MNEIEELKKEHESVKQRNEAENAQLKENYENMRKEKQDWELEKQRMHEIQQINDIVQLNIGGNKNIEVRKSTLTAVKGSALEALFSGRHQL